MSLGSHHLEDARAVQPSPPGPATHLLSSETTVLFLFILLSWLCPDPGWQAVTEKVEKGSLLVSAQKLPPFREAWKDLQALFV